MDYKQKYLKYRQKYLKLKYQSGGALCLICGGDHDTHDCPTIEYIPAGEANGLAGPAVAASAAGPEDDDGWTTVTKRPKKIRSERPPVRNIPRDELLSILRRILSRYEKYIEGGYVYGSRARGTNRIDSDADIIVFWRSIPDIDLLKQIRAEIEAELGFEIDFVSCWYTKHFIEHFDLRDQSYFDNVAIDAKQFIGKTISINALIDRSVKMPKLNRK